MSRFFPFALAAVLSCSDPPEPTEGDVIGVPTDVGTIDSGHSALPELDDDVPTDVTADCWSWTVRRGVLLHETTLRVYDPATLEVTHLEVDVNGDDLVEYSWDAAYEPSGDYSWLRYDVDGDGDYDETYAYTYDADGHAVRFEEDLDGDGTFDEVWTYEIEGDRRRVARADEGADGTTDVLYLYTYDVFDRLIRIDADRGVEAVIDEIYVLTYATDTTRDYTLTFDADADGVAEDTYTYAFDEHDRTIAETVDRADGLVTSEFLEYVGPPVPGEETGRWHGSFAYPGSAPYDFSVEYTYESPGRIARVETEMVFEDSTGHTTETWTWTCP